MTTPDYSAGWWLTIPEICADLQIDETDWQEWHEADQTPQQVTGPDGIDRVHRADFEAWMDFLAVSDTDPEDWDR